MKKRKTVAGGEYVESLAKAIEERRLLVIFGSVMLLVILYQQIQIHGLAKAKEIHIEMPPKIVQGGQVIIGNNHANAFFYELWGRYLAQEELSFTPMDVLERHERLLSYVHPKNYLKLKKRFLGFVENVRENVITHTFTMREINVHLSNDHSRASVDIDGHAVQVVGAGKQEEQKECTYRVVMQMEEGHVYLEDIATNCF